MQSSKRVQPEPRIPRGWYRAVYSDEVAAGDVVPLSILDRELVAYRGKDGAVRIVDAYCPHLGAHLGHGGRVDGNVIVCPFHGWSWDGHTGECRAIPYAKRIPAAAQLSVWQTRELNGYVIIWYDEEGGEPDFEIPEIPETSDPRFELFKRVEWTLDTHIQEVYENVVDIQHFISLHGMTVNEASWNPVDGKNGPIVRLHVEIERDNAEQSGEDGETSIESFMFGTGLQVTRLRGRLEGASVNSLVPLADGKLKVAHSYYVSTDSAAPTEEIEAFWKYYMDDHALDFNIWNHKTYLANPVLAAEDGDIGGFRRWFRQFYPRSVSAADQREEVRGDG